MMIKVGKKNRIFQLSKLRNFLNFSRTVYLLKILNPILAFACARAESMPIDVPLPGSFLLRTRSFPRRIPIKRPFPDDLDVPLAWRQPLPWNQGFLCRDPDDNGQLLLMLIDAPFADDTVCRGPRAFCVPKNLNDNRTCDVPGGLQP